MNCTMFENRLAAAVENRRPFASAELREHASSCDKCRVLWEQHAVLEHAIPCWRDRREDVDLTESILAQVLSIRASQLADRRDATVTKPTPDSLNRVAHAVGTQLRKSSVRSVRPQRQRWAVVAVAALLLLCSLTALHTARNRSVSSFLLAKNATPRIRVANELEITQVNHQSLDTLVRDVSSAWLVLAKEATESVTSVAVLIPGEMQPSMPQDNEPPTSTWFEEWQDHLKPIGHDVERAFDFLIEAAPFDSTPTT